MRSSLVLLTIFALSVPTRNALPARIPSGRSVVSRMTNTGLPRDGASSCTPPESETDLLQAFVKTLPPVSRNQDHPLPRYLISQPMRKRRRLLPHKLSHPEEGIYHRIAGHPDSRLRDPFSQKGLTGLFRRREVQVRHHGCHPAVDLFRKGGTFIIRPEAGLDMPHLDAAINVP